ncbi:hypothetical protein G3O08_17380 [Cryomorpha ignava]|uniref:Lipoprotein n=1 Tax=Cryomorpha ignava TaxID=101383 RepID=A0A7K3WWH4_9FLAO|nr:hypothetical protein [Cryomorpha ignava]NEN25272.1 hypothetical protein [Cryomorpha ignava]
MRLFSLLVFVFALISCQSEPQPEQKIEMVGVEAIFGTEKGALFRGSNISDQPKQIRTREKAIPTIDSDSLIEYDYTYQLKSGYTEMHVFYTFDEFGLFEIQVDFYPESDEKAKDLLPKLEEQLTSRFGEPKENGLSKRWTTFSVSNNIIEITLSNESLDAENAFISLNYLEPLPDEI